MAADLQVSCETGNALPPGNSRPVSQSDQMKLAGFLLLLSGWGIVVATLPLLPSFPARAAFVLAGMGVELLGLALVARSYLVPKG